MSASRAIQAKEREVQVKRLSKLARGLLLSVATLMTFATVALLFADKMYRPDSFAIEQVKIKGKFELLDVKDVQEKVVSEGLGNFFSVDLDAVQSRVKSLSWVKSADVRREWPNTLAIDVAEHRPVMRWKTLGSSEELRSKADQWVSASGQIVGADARLNKVSPILLKGVERDASRVLSRALQWQRRFDGLGLKLREVSLSQSQSWQLVVVYEESGHTFDLLLGKKNIEQRLQRFQVLYEQQFRVSDQVIVRADARYPDGLAMVAESKPTESENGAESEQAFVPATVTNPHLDQVG